MKFLLLIAAVAMIGCASGNNTPASNPACTGNSGATLTCSQGSCSHTGGSGCSAFVDGVSCCGGGSGGSSDGTSTCAVGWCWTNPENVCCPRNAQYACHGSCYTTNVCNYTFYQSACHN